MRTLALLLLAAPQDTAVTIKVVEQETGSPIFARVVLRDAAGRAVDSTGYKTFSGHIAFPEGWSLALPKGAYTLEADAGYEFFAHKESWTVSAGGEKKVALRRWADFRKRGWYAGGDHNHLNRNGSQNKNYGGTSVTMEFAASLLASRGWAYYACGGGGPWIVNGGGTCDAKDANNQTLNNGRRTEAAAAEWNAKHGALCHLWWNNEEIKSRYGHLWFLGKASPTFAYSDEPADAWWSMYDDAWDPWQTGDRSKPIPPYSASGRLLPPPADAIKTWRDRGLLAFYAHPTRTFMIGKNRVSNIAVTFPFDLLSGAPVGGLVVMGDHFDHAEDQALWFAALNEGYRVPGVAENDTVFGDDSIRVAPYVTYTHVPDMGAGFDFAKLTAAMGAGRNFVSSGAFCTIRLDGKHAMGDTVLPDGKEHPLEIEAWASANPADSIKSLQVIVNGRVAHEVAAAKGKREWKGSVPLKLEGARWAIVKLLGETAGVAAITNPIYFATPPEPATAKIFGRATKGEAGVPAEILVTLWGKEIGRTKAGEQGNYSLDAVPLAAHLRFVHEGKTVEKVPLYDSALFWELHHEISSTKYVGTKGALAGCFPPHVFRILRGYSQFKIDAAFTK